MFDCEGKEWGLKPMNCPGHCMMFRHMNPSYRQLPLRLADFGVLHRNELSGSLTGLTRVRRFQQDDAHIFCRMDQVKDEVTSALNFLFYIYGVFGFKFELNLSTRPSKALGSKTEWDSAETQLKDALDDGGCDWTLNPGDGAFYGPKIDIRLQDALQRWHQCGTIQLDFQLPRRFNLQYRNEEIVDKGFRGEEDHVVVSEKTTSADSVKTTTTSAGTTAQQGVKIEESNLEQELKPGFERPVMIHRAILGSVERMAAVLIEHTAGRLPFWLSPRQVIICTITEKVNEYGAWVRDILHTDGYHVSLDASNHTINKKVRNAELERWNYILVVGLNEAETATVTIRETKEHSRIQLSVKDLLDKLRKLNMPCSRPPTSVDEPPKLVR